MPVLNTASPKVSPSAPKESPEKLRPSSRTRTAGVRGDLVVAGCAGACGGTPYLLLRLTGRIVKGCRATPTLPAAPPGRRVPTSRAPGWLLWGDVVGRAGEGGREAGGERAGPRRAGPVS